MNNQGIREFWFSRLLRRESMNFCLFFWIYLSLTFASWSKYPSRFVSSFSEKLSLGIYMLQYGIAGRRRCENFFF